jgi:hypothetical protein
MLELAAGSELPPHQPNCFGCGPRNQAGREHWRRAGRDGDAGPGPVAP